MRDAHPSTAHPCGLIGKKSPGCEEKIERYRRRGRNHKTRRKLAQKLVMAKRKCQEAMELHDAFERARRRPWRRWRDQRHLVGASGMLMERAPSSTPWPARPERSASPSWAEGRSRILGSVILDIRPLVGHDVRMGTVKKAKISVTIDSDLLAEIDAFAERSGIANRSNVIELWLRRAARNQVAKRLDEETAAYYTRLTAAEARDDAEWTSASTDELARLGID